MGRSPIFLERRGYRLRRLMDAVRLLPFLGVALWMVPLMWPLSSDGGASTSMSTALRYVFGIWVLLVLVSWALQRRTKESAESGSDARSGEQTD